MLQIVLIVEAVFGQSLQTENAAFSLFSVVMPLAVMIALWPRLVAATDCQLHAPTAVGNSYIPVALTTPKSLYYGDGAENGMQTTEKSVAISAA